MKVALSIREMSNLSPMFHTKCIRSIERRELSTFERIGLYKSDCPYAKHSMFSCRISRSSFERNSDTGNSLYGALAYNGEKINEAKGRLLTTNCIYNDGTGTMDIHRAMEDFLALMPVRSKVEKPVVHISLNPHPDDILTDTELQDIAWEYLEKMGFGNQPYLVFKHEDICLLYTSDAADEL